MTLFMFYHSFLYQQTCFYMNLNGKIENNSCPVTDAAAWFLLFFEACIENYVTMRIQTNYRMRFTPRLMYYFLFSNTFTFSNKSFLHRENNASWYLTMIILWHWCGSMHGCFCLHPFKVLVFFVIHIRHHVLGLY